MIKTIDAGTKGAIWDKSSEQNHTALKKDNFNNAQFVIFDEYKMI